VRPGPGVLRFALVALVAALVVVALKFAAYAVTGSVAILSDALESTVNVVAAIAAVLVLRIADRPPDEEHAYGHGKVEYFSGGFEGALIVVAALVIALTAGSRLLDPRPVTRPDIGLAVVVWPASSTGGWRPCCSGRRPPGGRSRWRRMRGT
jgi:cation diffusion facilitator family transporter